MRKIVLGGLVVLVFVINSCTANNPVGSSGSAPAPAPVTQTLWKNGVMATTMWGQSLSLTTTGAVITNAAVTNNLTGDTTVLAVSAPAGYFNYFFSIPTPVDATSYYAAGHIQFDIMAGTSMPVFYVSYRNSTNGNGCSASPLSGLSQTQFVHISIPFSTLGSASCGGPAGLSSLSAINGIGGYDLPDGSSGVRFYIDNVQITSN